MTDQTTAPATPATQPLDATEAPEAPEASANAVVPKQNGAMTTADDNDFSGFAGEGFQGLNKDDLAIPFLTILQSGSPQVKRSEGEYIPGAAEGMLFNSVTREIYDPVADHIFIVPCAYDRYFVEWRIRENGGGFKGQHSVDEGETLLTKAMRDDKNRDIIENGNQLNDTRTFYVMIYNAEEGTASPALITMTSTQIKKSKQWLMQQNLLKLRGPNGPYTPPMYASKWRVTTVPESNEKGSWMGWAFTHEGYLKGPQDPVFVEAQKFAKSVKSGAVKPDFAKAPDGVTGDEDIPFISCAFSDDFITSKARRMARYDY
jgi:hypothetical protein